MAVLFDFFESIGTGILSEEFYWSQLMLLGPLGSTYES